jgi:hypothetical protein
MDNFMMGSIAINSLDDIAHKLHGSSEADEHKTRDFDRSDNLSCI